ncbi:MAG: helix-turn-helix domain-containing protein [bacterium]|nr:helix-turn-helix domain-containing protein [bacterium]
MNHEKVTVEEYLSLIYEQNNQLLSAIRMVSEQKSIPQTETNFIEDYLSANQAAGFLKIKLSTLYSKVTKGELPHSKSGKRKLLFSKKDLENYIAKRKVKSHDEINQEVENYLLKKNR